MEIIKNANGEALTVKVVGRLDTTTAPSLEAELKDSFDETDSLVLDFKDLEYVSSAGLRVILMAQKTMSKKGGMRLINVNSVVMDVFEVTGFVDILTIE